MSNSNDVLVKSLNKYLLVFIVLAEMVVNIYSQPQKQQFRFKLYSTEQGLTSTEIYSVIQDKPGYLWVGTTNGLFRFDGYTFNAFQPIPFDTTSLSEGFVSSLCEDHDGNIWTGTTEHGLNKLNPRTGKVKRFFHVDNDASTLSDNSPTSLHCDSDGNIWIGTAFGNLDMIKPRTGMVKHVITSSQNKQSIIKSIIQDAEGNVWVASAKRIHIIDSQKKIRTVNFDFANNTQQKVTHSFLYKDLSNTIWLGSSGRLWKFNRTSEKFSEVSFTPPNFRENILTITAICEESTGVFWIATNNGVFRFDHKSNSTIELNEQAKFPNELKTVLPRTLTIDKTGVVWIGYGLYGVLSVQPFNQSIKTFGERTSYQDGLPNKYVRGLAEDKNKNLWIGTYNGLARLDSSLKYFLQLGEPILNKVVKEIAPINALYVDAENTIWIGTNTSGLFSYSIINQKFLHVLGTGSLLNDKRDNVIFEIKHDKFSNLWICTDRGGVVVIDKDGKYLRRYCKESKIAPLPDNQVRTILEDKNGQMWIGTFSGLCKLNPITNEAILITSNENNPSSLINPFVLALYQDHHKRIWVGTRAGISILEPNGKVIRNYSTASGLVNDIVVGLAEDSKGKMWVSTYGGIMVLNDSLKTLNAYFEADGLQSDLFNTGATLLLSSGKIAFGGAHGLSIVSTNILESRMNIPSVVIQAFKHNNNPVTRAVSTQEKGTVTLEPNENSVRFEFAALDFRFSRGNIYSYKLAGFDKDWITTFSRRSVTYIVIRNPLIKF